MQRAVIVHNPASRNAPSHRRLEAAARPFAGRGWQVELCATEAPGHAVELAREAAAGGAAVVFACGGDGTINEVINGIAGSPSALGVLRGGMGDVFGREAAIPRPPEEALQVLTAGERRRFDLGRANGRYFLMMAGVGFDAEVVRAVPGRPKRLLGSTSYALWGAAVLARHRSKQVELRIDGETSTARLYWLMLGNTRSYGGVIRIAEQARVDDGLLDAYVFEARGPASLVTATTRIARHRLEGSREIAVHRVRELEVVTPGLGVQIDGEYIGETPVRFEVAPAALDILLPRGAVPWLFGAAPVAEAREQTAISD